MSEKASKGRKPVRPGAPVPPAGAATSPAVDDEKPVEEQGAVASDDAATGGAFEEAAPDFNDYGGKPKKKHRVLKAAAVVLAALLVIGGVRWMLVDGPFKRQTAEIAMGDAYSESLSADKYDLQTPQYDLRDGYQFTFDFDEGVDLGLQKLGDSSDYQSTQNLEDAAKVYVDPNFSLEFPTRVQQVSDEDGNRLEVEADYTTATDLADADNNKGDDIFHYNSRELGKGQRGGRWYGFGGYYLVRYIGADGKKLDKPQVTYFTVKNDVTSSENALAAPQNVVYQVEDNGGLGVSWDKVDGASQYKVYMRVYDPTADTSDGLGRKVDYRLLAVTDKTKINTLDFDAMTKASQDYAENGGITTFGGAGTVMTSQNAQFKDLVIGDNEDDIFGNRQDTQEGRQGLEVADYQPNASHVKAVSLSVVACGMDSDQQSPFKFRSINSLLGQLPIEVSYNMEIAWKRQAPDGATDPAGFLKNRLFTYVIMADGTCASVLNDFDVSKMTSKQSTKIEGEDENDPSTWHKRSYTYSEIPYRVRNTVFTDVFSFEGGWFPGGGDQIKQVTDEQLKAIAQSNPGSGAPQRAQMKSDIDWNQVQKDQKISDTTPKVDYPVNGSSDYVKFVAANILAGNMAIDISQYANKPGAPDFDWVFNEALAQNPMCLLCAAYTRYNTRTEGDKTIVSIYDGFTTEHNDAQKMIERRKQVWAEVKKLVDGAVKDGMSEEEKVKAINDAMADRLTYDYDMFYLNDGQIDLVTDPVLKKNPFLVRAYSAEELLNDNKVVCAGYAAIFKACADYAGIESLYITGDVPPVPGRSSNKHAWNLVKVGDAWKVVDTTWDDSDQGTSGGGKDEYVLLDQKDPKLAGRTYDRDTMPYDWYDENVDASLLTA